MIEPDYIQAEIYRRALVASGHMVVPANTAQQAINQADMHPLDLVILELQLVEHSGIEFLYEFRSYDDWVNIPIIIYSQIPPKEFSASARILSQDIGVVKYLYKPQISLEQLISNITKLNASKLK